MAEPAQRRLLGRLAAASGIAGIGLLNVADTTWAHAIGVTCLIGFVVLAFAAIVVPALDEQAAAGSQGLPGTARAPTRVNHGRDRVRKLRW
jgi:hypothetical protein